MTEENKTTPETGADNATEVKVNNPEVTQVADQTAAKAEKSAPAAETVDPVKASTDAPAAPATDAPAKDGEKKDEAKPADGRPQRGGFRGRGGQGGNRGRGGPGGARGGRGRGGRRKNFRREKPEFDQKIVSLRRVTRVMAGGRRFSFSCAIVIGDKKGRVGFGLAKANDTAAAIDKAIRIAKKDMITLKLTENNSIPHDVRTKYKASEVLLRPVSGKGLAAGGGVRTVLELAGVDEVGGKLLSRSKNNINNARATIQALKVFAVKPSKAAKAPTAQKTETKKADAVANSKK